MSEWAESGIGEDAVAVGGFDAPAPDVELGGARFQRIGLEYGPVSDGLTGLLAQSYSTTVCFFGPAWVA
jgi:hypothetical protein